MKQLRFPVVCFAISICSLLAHAQDNSAGAAAGAGTGAGILGCSACSVVILIPIIIVVLNIALLVWVARDAKARAMDVPVLWMLLVFFTSFIGLIVYLLVRPKGNKVPCANCGNKRLETIVKCPSCGIDG